MAKITYPIDEEQCAHRGWYWMDGECYTTPRGPEDPGEIGMFDLPVWEEYHEIQRKQQKAIIDHGAGMLETWRTLALKPPPDDIIGKAIWFFGVIGQMIMSIATFPASLGCFLMEEMVQTAGMGAYILSSARYYDLLTDYLPLYRDVIETAKTTTLDLALFSPIVGGTVLQYIDAATLSYNAFDAMARRKLVEQAETDEELRLKLEAEQKYGIININSTPSLAEIWIDDVNTELLTPQTFKNMEAKDYIFELRKFNTKTEEYDIFVFTVTVEAGRRKELKVNIPSGLVSEEEVEPVTYGQLRLSSHPSTAEIWINGENTGKLTPEYFRRIDAGTYGIKLRVYRRQIEAWLEYEFTTTIVAGEKTELHIIIPIPEREVEPEPEPPDLGAFRIISAPTDAKIYIDDVDTGMLTPETFKDLKPGPYVVRLERTRAKADGIQTLTTTIAVEKGKRIEVKLFFPAWEKPEVEPIPPGIVTETETRLPDWIKASVIGDHAIDGDSFITFKGENVRILGIDAPEKGLPWSKEAQTLLHERIKDNTVQLLIQSSNPRDQYGRTLAVARVAGDTIAFRLLEAGLARVYVTPQDIFHDYNYIEAEDMAKERRIGIWGEMP